MTTTTAQGVLAGRVALVTGGASGIGRATAELFAEQGAAVVVADVNDAGEETVAAITEAGGQATFVRGDVSVEADVEAMVQAAESVYGGLDAAFNNAGIAGSDRGRSRSSTAIAGTACSRSTCAACGCA